MVNLLNITNTLPIKNKKENLLPEILCQQHVPKPLHGINPRTILGREKWDKERFKAQKETNYTCKACGVNRKNAKEFKGLDCHEVWDINHTNGCCKVIKLIPLCRYCHLFIHSGYLKTRNDEKLTFRVLTHGFSILKGSGLKVFQSTYLLAKEFKINTYDVGFYIPKINNELKWTDYYLLFKGKKYFSNFQSKTEWENFYNNKG